MNDSITQTRLSMRLDAYLREYTGKNSRSDALSSAEWDIVWQVANSARIQNMLTPELVDDVRKVLKQIETTREKLQLSSSQSPLEETFEPSTSEKVSDQ